MIEVSNIATHLLVTGGLLSVLVLGFLALFLVPGVIHWFRLRNILSGVGSLEAKTSPGDFKKLFMRDKQLAHLWAEYSESLHVQREERDGQMQVVAVRSTIAADTYFNEQFVVDSRLRTEFFKHLPGIFTGLGIIGTFTGLIEGLRRFQVSENAATVRASLESLMHAVGEAFLISAAAITAAMAVTFLEKLLLAALYRKTEAIAHGIDARFEAGAGEEYLSRLVNASEASASQSKILKDALVKELGDILRELTASQLSTGQQLHAQLAQRIEESTNRQVEAAREDNQVLGDIIAGSIEKSLKGPLDKIANSVETASGDQSATAVKMLNDIMVSFSQRLNDLFGGQINGINELNKQTAQGMQDAVASLNALVGKLEESGKKTTDDMAAQMAASIRAMEERQASINTQTEEFVDQIRQLVQSSQAETQQKLQATLDSIGQQMTTILSKLSESQAKVFEDNRAREQSMADRASNAVSEMTGSVEAAVKEISAASQTMAQSVSTLTAATASTVDKMSAGANRLDTAATNFAAAGDRVTSAMGQAATVSGKLTELSGALTTSSGALQEALRDYKSQRDAVSALLGDVRATVELAKKEVSLTGDVLQRIETSTTKLSQAQKAADEYLDGVSQVLADSSDAFRESVVSTLAKVNHDFHTKLSSAVGLLSTAVQELEVTLGGSLAARR
ncbi:MAG: chromosome segregation protein SMC [Candidatus Accumulibacter appositus]|uniref:Chromosome segregation protein SMC n=1 Tax=Candidatus Accumulibacter appositus TaxID=1454003 RepID=A0A011NIG4_9PROT|nr:anti-phage ZorAB system protein ZorA [Accumulibacter sp.]EXI82583.1 MAG: chromosome segregation protein SMC [Candidatus Accumulibacter appositus]HRF05031.1 anti-phage ZorAB system protein ZorA [Accumulibacter sp.]